MGKTVKEWGTIGGLTGYSQSWSSPSTVIMWQQYRKDDTYSETAYSGPADYLATIAAACVYHIDPATGVLTYYELTQTAGHPYDKLTVRTGTAQRVIDDNA